ncbi:sortase A [Corynebacterium mycetoides]|uniref:Sortase A n=1 Tax=Corynebacterium mycetoides TaxID=38302 RepID=A0A1G9Q1W7_9CORY|nr:class C sortase [Corynebacterium mycetoides]SDM04487.1 sortase A [Corynebacterium mycetoides]
MSIAAPPSAGAHRAPSGPMRRVIIPALIMLLGMAVLLYPVVATQWNNWLQQKAVSEYQADAQELATNDPAAASAAVESARRFNEAHTDGPIFDPWLARISEDNPEYQSYLDELSGLTAMSHVAIPSINSSLPVYHGTSAETLQKGVGHLYGSALPVGGVNNHTVLTGHTGLINATLWDNLVDVEVGDAIYVSTFGERLKYEVHDIEVVLPDETDSLKSVARQDLLTLITCTPYGINTHRLLIHAHRVPMDPSEAGVFDESSLHMQWWMWPVLAVVAVSLAAMARWIYIQNKRAREQA